MTWLAFVWLFGSLVVTPLALYWRPGARGWGGSALVDVMLAIVAGAILAGVHLHWGGIA